MLWSYGITCVPSRFDTTLPHTLASLAKAGFDKPRLFIDGDPRRIIIQECTVRNPKVGPWGNWYLSLLELYIREPVCERYAIFQDDVIAVRGLREYLEACRYPDGKDGREPGFWNLFTFLNSEWDADMGCGWIQGAVNVSEPEGQLQCCRGALGLVFNREAVQIILSSRFCVGKAADANRPQTNIDGCVVTAMNMHRRPLNPDDERRWPRGWREYVHGPSLLSHIGTQSSLPTGKVWQKNTELFPGEEFDAKTLVKRD